MKKHNIDPKYQETEDDIIGCELVAKLKTTTQEYFKSVKTEDLTSSNFQTIFNALMNYFHHTLYALIHCIKDTKDQLHFVKNVDSSLHHILSHLLNEIGNDTTKH